MATTFTPNTVPGLFKDLYRESGLVDALPSFAIVQDKWKFKEAEALGQYFIMGVKLQYEHGFSYAPSSGASTTITLNAAVTGYVGRAQIEGYAIYMRSRLDYAAAAKAATKGKRAFAQAYQCLMENMKASFAKRLELTLLYGQRGLGTVSGINTGVITITTATWASGIWVGMKDAILEAFTGVTASETQHDTDLTISAVSIANKTVTVTGTSSSVAAADVLHFKGARTATAYNEAAGLDKILATTSGTIFNISATSYELWRPQAYAVSGALSLTSIINAVNLAQNFGLDGDCTLLVAPEKFAPLAVDETALRRYVSQGDSSNTKRGVKGVQFQNGGVTVDVVSHPFVKQGTPMLLPDSAVKRIGATDITFAMPGSGDAMEVHVTDSNALEIRGMADQAIYIETPAQAVLMTGVV